MSTKGPNFGGTAADDSGTGTVTWSSTGNAVGVNPEDGVNAQATLGDASLVSHFLKITGFSFDVPAGSTMLGILAEWKKSYTGTPTALDNAVRIVKGGTIGSTDKSNLTAWPSSLSYVSYGGAADLWGETWTPADINASTFGVAISVTGGSLPGGFAAIDCVRVTVYYTLPTLTKRLLTVLGAGK